MHIGKRDSTGTVRRDFATTGGIALAHLPQMYSLYELYFDAALAQLKAGAAGRDTAHLRQFYIDREFDKFPLHDGVVRPLPGNRAEIQHDWLSGTGEPENNRSLAHSRFEQGLTPGGGLRRRARRNQRPVG